MKMLEVQNLTVRYGETTIVEDISFSLEEGQWLMLIGPNGAGKSTIVRALSQSVDYQGVIRYGGQDIKTFRPAQWAREMGVLAQSHGVDYSFTVGEVVRLGRYAHSKGVLRGRGNGDEEKVRQALELTGLTDLAGQSVLTLSGGELQRTFLAQLFAQDPNLLVLDEPTNHLDLVFQKQIFALIENWRKQPGRAVLSVVHDLSLARAYGTEGLLLCKGKAAAQGSIDEIFAPRHLNRVYDMDVYAWMQGLFGQWQSPRPAPADGTDWPSENTPKIP